MFHNLSFCIYKPDTYIKSKKINSTARVYKCDEPLCFSYKQDKPYRDVRTFFTYVENFELLFSFEHGKHDFETTNILFHDNSINIRVFPVPFVLFYTALWTRCSPQVFFLHDNLQHSNI